VHLLDPFGFGRPGFLRHARRFEPLPDARGLTVAITGANSGLGLAATRELAQRGATVWMVCRDRARAEAAREGLVGDIRVAVLDVADLRAVRSFELPTPDVLVHNAGMLAARREEVDGIERTVATHVVGPWALGQRLQAASTIWVSSGGMYSQRLDVDATFDPPAPFDGVKAYARCKRAQVVLARRLSQHVMHPGWADSPGVATSLPTFYKITRGILRTPAEGADTIVWLALTRPAPGFWFDRAPAAEHALPWTRGSDAEEERLLARLEALTGSPAPRGQA
jgi:dehydrogenase/reductase SDR family protein 12